MHVYMHALWQMDGVVHQAIHGRCVQVPPTWQAVRVAEQEDGISSRRRAGQGRRR